MAELIARDLKTNYEHWRHRLQEGLSTTLGRDDQKSQLAVKDAKISSTHASVCWRAPHLYVRRLENSTNPIFHRPADVSVNQAQPLSRGQEIKLGIGESFFIGDTVFSVEAAAAPQDTGGPQQQFTCRVEDLRDSKFDDADYRLEVLTALPAVIRYSPTDSQLESRVVDVLLQGIKRATLAAIVRVQARNEAGQPNVEVLQVRQRAGLSSGVRPSRRLIAEAVENSCQPLLYLWSQGILGQTGSLQLDSAKLAKEMTVHAELPWAFCVPLTDDGNRGLGVYIAGKGDQSDLDEEGRLEIEALRSDMKFALLVAEVFGSLRQVLELQRRQSMLNRFLSQPVLAAIGQRDIDEVLRPRETLVTVLFTDLRGSCQIAESGQDNLASLWDRMSEAVGTMGSKIIDQDGVIGDFQGDAAMGFWGWPIECPDQIERAARAALNIRRRFSQAMQKSNDPLGGMGCGIGIAHGPAIAGRLGTLDQFKIDVFGPVVNLASRLEGMTKLFKVPIVVDDKIGKLLSQGGGHWVRCRRLARVRPMGMSRALDIYELLQPLGVEAGITEALRRDYEGALDEFMAGRWQAARNLLQRMPADGPSQFLLDTIEELRDPPPGWDGIIVPRSK